jgi:PAS domain-containing protein
MRRVRRMDILGKFRFSKADDSRYRHLIEAIEDYAIYMLDLTGIVTSWNSGAERVSGFTAAFTALCESLSQVLITLLLRTERVFYSLYANFFSHPSTRTAERPDLALFLFVLLGLCRLSDTDGVRARHGLL